MAIKIFFFILKIKKKIKELKFNQKKVIYKISNS